ncbi:metal-sulfur cluster assembly factor [Companilactobacillus insicii]|uniref:metal-sulfur cluster assembly factor n=1 Tax=Companilactobacillus insicii TaxID=1732567 RepID=UPI000F7AE646|nr:metal-sulfur cluster assembly factor [Companilactobacillus insicii]
MGKAKSIEGQLAGNVMCALEGVIDPELGVDVVNLGIIYNVEIVDNTCKVTMTLTHMWCPASDYLKVMICRAAESVDGIDSCEVELVSEPKWTVDKMSRVARIAMNME